MAFELFKPPDDGLKFIDEYPELGEIPEFRGLSEEQMLFAYLMGCPSSPYFDNKNDEKKKRTVCFTKAFPHEEGPIKTKYLNGTYPEIVAIAIDIFRKFRPSDRMRAKHMVENMFKAFEGMVNQDENELELIKDDPDSAKKYIEISQKVVNLLPEILKMKERGFGVTLGYEETDKDDSGETLLDQAVT